MIQLKNRMGPKRIITTRGMVAGSKVAVVTDDKRWIPFPDRVHRQPVVHHHESITEEGEHELWSRAASVLVRIIHQNFLWAEYPMDCRSKGAVLYVDQTPERRYDP